MSIEAVGHRIVVRPDPVQEYSEGGIALTPDKNRELAAQTFGTVVDIGPQAFYEFGDGTPWVEVGDRIAYAKYAGMTIREDEESEEYVVLNDQDIIGRIPPEAKVKDLEKD